MNISRGELINQLVEKQHYTKKAATMVVDDFVAIVMDNLRAGNSVSINNFGTFDLLHRADHYSIHPVTHERVDIPAHYIPKFYPSKAMRAAVKLWEDSKNRGLE